MTVGAKLVSAARGITKQINYQGKLLTSSSIPVQSGTFVMRFSIYDAESGGNRLWTASGTLATPATIDVPVTSQGLLSILLGSGSQNSLESVDWNTDTIYLGVTVATDTEMTPRKRIGAVAQAFNSEEWNGYRTATSVQSGSELLKLEQLASDAAASTRTTFLLTTSGTSNINDYLFVGQNSSQTVFTISRQGHTTTTGNFAVSGQTILGDASSDLVVVNAQVASDFVPDGNGTRTLGSTTNRWNGWFGSTTATAANITALTFGTASGSGLVWTNATGTNTTSTNLFTTNLLFTSASGSNIFVSGTASATQLFVSGQSVCLANGTNCPSGATLDDWSYTASTDLLFTTTNTASVAFGGATENTAPFFFRRNTTSTRLILGGNGSSTDLVIGASTSSNMNSSFQLDGNDLFVAGNIGSASSVYTNGAFIAGTGTTMYGDGFITRTNGSLAVSSTGELTLNTNDIITIASGYGSTIIINDDIALNTSESIILTAINGVNITTPTTTITGGVFIGTSTIDVVMNSGFGMTGVDLFVGGNIGSASSVYTNGAFIAGTGTTMYGDGFITRTNGSLAVSSTGELTLNTNDIITIASGYGSTIIINDDIAFNAPESIILTAAEIELTATLGINLMSRTNAKYLNMRNWVPLLYQTIDGRNATTTVGDSPWGVAFDGTHIWVANNGSGNVSKIDPLTNAVIATTTVGTGPTGVVFDGTHIWVTNAASGIVSKIDIKTNAVVATTAVGTGPNFAAFDGTHVWVTNNGSGDVSKIDITTNAVVATTTVGTSPAGIAFDGSHMWVANDGSSNVSKIDITTNAVVATTTVGSGPRDVAFDGTNIWVTNNGTDNVSKIDITTNAVVATTTVGTAPTGIAFDGTHLWVANTGSFNVSKINIGGGGGNTFAVNGNLTVGGTSVCLANGTNCPSSATIDDWSYTAATNLLFTTTNTASVAFGGATEATAPFFFRHNTTSTRLILGGNGSSTDLVIGASTSSITNTAFQLTGDDMFVAGNIGSASSVYTNGAFIAGSGTTLFGDGFITNTNATLTVDARNGLVFSATSTFSKAVTVTGRLDAKYLNMRNWVPLMYQTIDGRRATTTVGSSPFGVAFDGSHIWVTNFGSGNVSKIDVLTNAVIATIPVGTSPSGLAFDGTHMWVANFTTNNVSKINITTNAVVATTTAGTGPAAVAFDGTHIWVANNTSGDVNKIDITTNAVVATTTVGSGPLGAVFDGTHIWVTNSSSDNVSKIDITTNAVVATTTAGGGAQGPAFDGTHIWVANNSTDNLSKIDIKTNLVVATTTVGSGPRNIVFDGTHIWVTNTGVDYVSKIDINTNAVVATTTVGDLPRGIAFDGTHIWVVNNGSGNVSKLNIGGGYGNTFAVNGTLIVSGSGTSTFNGAVSSTRGEFSSGLTVGGTSVCLANGTNCPVAASSPWLYDGTNNLVYTSTSTADVAIGGATQSSAPVFFRVDTTSTRVLLGANGSSTDLVIGASTSSITNSAFQLTGDDMFVAGNIGSASSVYTNGAFIAGSGTTLFGDGFITNTNATLTVDARNGLVFSATSTFSKAVTVTGRLDAKYLSMRNWVPLLYQTIDGRRATTTVGSSPIGVAFDGTHIWVANFGSANVSKIDALTNTVAATVPVGSSPIGVAFDGTSIWVTNSGSANVSKINITTNQVVATTTVESNPQGIVFDGTHIWVTNFSAGDVSKIDITTNAVVATTTVGTSPSAAAFDGTHVWVANYITSNVSKIDITTNVVVATTTVGTGPRGITFDGTHIWVTNEDTDNVSKIDITTNAVVATTIVGSGPRGIVFDGRSIWVTNIASANVSKIDIMTNAVIATTTVGSGPRGIAFDGTHLWVANTGSANVSKINIGGGAGNTFAVNGNLTVGGTSVCLQSGTNCPTSATIDDWSYTAATNLLFTTTNTASVALGGSTENTAPFFFRRNSTSTRLILGGNGSSTDLVIGASTSSITNSAFQLDGNDLFVAGNIGSASSVYTNGAFIAGSGTTFYGDGFITNTNATLTVDARNGLVFSATSTFSKAVTVTGRLDAKYLSMRNWVPLLYQTIDGRNATTSVGGPVQGIAFDGTHMWVAHGGAEGVSKIDVLTNAVVATTAVGSVPVGVAFDGTHIWVTNFSSDNVSKIDITTNVVVATTTVGTGPQGIAFDGTHIWVANNTSDNVSKINISTNAVVATTTVGATPQGIAFDGTYIWVANTGSDNVSKIDISSNTVVATTTVGSGPIGAVFDGSHVWVTNNGSGNVSKIDITTNEVVATTTVGTGPQGIAFDGTHIWVANSGSDTVSKIDISTNAVVATTTVGSVPVYIAFDGTHVWVTNNGSGFVSKINIGGGYGNTFAVNGNLTVGGQAVCLQNGTNCPSSATIDDWSYTAATNLLFTTTNTASVAFGGSTESSAPFFFRRNTTSTRLILGGNGSSTDLVIGATTSSITNSAFQLDGNDLFVAGNIGSASSVYTNGAFVAGATTHFSDGQIARFNGGINVTSTADITFTMNGNVGIGTSTPAERLTVVGNIQNTLVDNQTFTFVTTTGGLAPAAIVVQGKYAYVAFNSTAGSLKIYDVTDPMHATSVGTLATANQPVDAAVSGRYAYLATQEDYVNVVDVSNPSNPVTVATTTGGGGIGGGLALSGHYIYAASVTSGTVRVIDISNPTSPVIVTSTYYGGAPFSITASGQYLYVAEASISTGTMSVLDISNPAAPMLISSTNFGESLRHISVSGRYAYVSNLTDSFPSSLIIVDISDPRDPVVVASTTDIGSEALGNDVSGRYVYTTDNTLGHVAVVDVSSSTNPVVVSTIPVGSTETVTVAGRYLYSGSDGGAIAIVDLGGIETNSLIAHSAEVGNLQVLTNGTIANQLTIGGSLQVGMGGILSGGSLAISATNTTSTIAYAVSSTRGEFSRQLTVGGVNVCLANGTNCPVGGAIDDWSYTAATNLLFTTTNTASVAFGGATESSAPFFFRRNTTSTRLILGGNGSSTDLVIGANTSSITNSAFQINGNDLFVAGNIGSASSVYTNGAFIAGSGSTLFGDGFITNTNATLTVDARNGLVFSATSTFSKAVTVTGRLDAPYLSMRNWVPLMYRSINGRNATTTLGTTPREIAFDGTHIWVTNSGTDNVTKIDVLTNLAVATTTVGTGPFGVAFDGSHIWVTNQTSDNVSKIDITTNRVVATTTVGDAPAGIAFDGTHMWVANGGTDNVSKINITTNAVDATVGVGDAPNGVAFDGSHIWVVNNSSGNVSKINITTNAVVATSSVGQAPRRIAFDGSHMWVSNGNATSVSKIDISSNAVVATTTVGASPSGVVFDGTNIWVANGVSNTVSKIDIMTNAVVATATVGTTPAGLAFDGTHIWSANFGSGDLTKINIGGGYGNEFTVNGVIVVNGSGTSTFSGAVSSTRGVFSSGLTVGGSSVCLQNGTNCPAGAAVDDWSYTASTNLLFTTTNTASVALGGSTEATSPFFFRRQSTSTRLILGANGSSTDLVIGASTSSGMHSAFQLGGNDLFVAGNIGSASSVYTNGAFVAGVGTTMFGSGFIANNSGDLTVTSTQAINLYGNDNVTLNSGWGASIGILEADISITSPGGINIGSVGGITMGGRVDADYLNRRIIVPLMYQTIDGRNATTTVGAGPRDAAFDGAYMWVTNNGSNSVSKIDPLTNAVVATATVGTNPAGIAFDGNQMWVANNGSDSVSRFNITTGAVDLTLPVGTDPIAIAFDGTHMWVANQGSANVSKIDISANEVVATTTVGTDPSGIAFDGTHMWVTNSGSSNVSKINITTNAVVATITVGPFPNGVAFDGTHIWVVNNGSDNVSKIDIKTNTVVATTAVDSAPNGIAFNGTHMWVTNSATGTVSKIDMNTNAVVATTTVGTTPLGIAFDGTHMWVMNNGSNNVSKINIGGGYGNTFAVNGNLTVGGTSVCLQNGTNCPAGGAIDDWSYTASTNLLFTTTNTASIAFGGATENTSPFFFRRNTTSTRLILGGNGSSTDLVIGATTSTITNSAFQLTGDDLFVAGNIGSASSVYTNGAFVAGSGTTLFGDGFITKTNGNLTVSSSQHVILQPQGGFVGIGTLTPDMSLTIVTTSSSGDGLHITNNGTGVSAGALIQLTNDDGNIGGLLGTASDYSFVPNASNTFVTFSNGQNMLFTVGGAGDMNFRTLTDLLAGTDTIHIEGTGATEGFVGFGTSTPNERLTVMGSIQNLLNMSVSMPIVGTSTFTATANPNDLSVSGRYVYVSNNGNNVVNVVDVTNPVSPVTVGTSTGLTLPGASVISGKYLYVLDGSGNGRLVVLNISNPVSPSPVGSYSFPSGNNPQGLAVTGRYAYVVNNDSGTLNVIDVADPASPNLVASATFSATGTIDVVSQGDYLYIITETPGNFFSVVNVSNPLLPVVVGTTTGVGIPLSIDVQGRYAYISSSFGNVINIIDVSSSTAPTIAGSITLTGGAAPRQVSVQGRYLYVANFNSSINVIDVSNPSAPFLAASTTHQAGATPRNITVSGRYAYISNLGNDTMNVIDLRGIETNTLMAGSIETGTLDVRSDANIYNLLSVGGGLNVGQGGILSSGAIGVSATNTTSSIMGNLTVGTSTVSVTMNSGFVLNGNDLFVGGNIGSASSVYSNGGFVVGAGSTMYGDGFISNSIGSGFMVTSSGALSLGGNTINITSNYGSSLSLSDEAVLATAEEIVFTATNGIQMDGRVNAPYLNRRNLVPLLYQTVNGLIATTTVSDEPYGIAFDGSYIWVSHSSTSLDTIVKIDPLSNQIIATTTVGGSPTAMAFDGEFMWVANNASSSVSKVDVKLNVTVGTVPVNSDPTGVAYDGSHIWVAHSGSTFLNKISTSTVEVVATTTLSGSGFQIAFDGTHIWASQNFFVGANVWKVNINTNQVVATTTLSGGDVPLSLAFDGSHMWVSGDVAIYKINTQTNQVVATTTITGEGGIGMAFDGEHMWVNDVTNDIIRMIDINTNAVVRTYPVGDQARQIAFDGTHIWNVNLGSDNVTKIPIGGGFEDKYLVGNNLLVGTSTVGVTMNSGFSLSGDDLFVGGNIGSASSVYTNGAFVAGTGTTMFGAGYFANNAGNLTVTSTEDMILMGDTGVEIRNGLGSFINVSNEISLTTLEEVSITAPLGVIITSPTTTFSGYVGIGTTTPTDFLSIYTTSTDSVGIRITNTANGGSSGAQIVFNNNLGEVGGLFASASNFSNVPNATNTLGLFTNGQNMLIGVGGAGDMNFRTLTDILAGTDTIHIEGTGATEGFVGFGTSNPTERLTVAGNVSTTGRWISSASSTIRGGLETLPDGGEAFSILSTTSVGSNNPLDVVVQGRYAYIVNQATTSSLRIYDYSDPSNPASISQTDAGSNLGIDVNGRYAYLLNGSGFRVFDVSNPKSPVQLVVKTTASTGQTDITVSGKYLYTVSDVSNRLEIYDVSNPAQPVQQANFNTSTFSGLAEVYVQGKYAYIVGAAGGGGLTIVDITTSTSPNAVGFVDLSGTEDSVFVQGRYAYVGNRSAGSVSIVDVSNPTLPRGVASSTGYTLVEDVFVSGRYLYVADDRATGENTTVVDVSSSTNPITVGTATISGDIETVFVSGKLLYATEITSDRIIVSDLQGMETNALFAHTAELGNLQVRTNGYVENNFDIKGALTVGDRSFFNHDVSIFGNTNATSALLRVTANCNGSTQNIAAFATNTHSDDGVSIRCNGQVFADSGTIGTGGDYAEYFYSSDESLISGDVVAIDTATSQTATRGQSTLRSETLGVVSRLPVVTGMGNLENVSSTVLVGLLGQLDVSIDATVNAIMIGDKLMMGATGTAIKATGPGMVIGTALDSLAAGTGTIRAFVNPHWWAGDLFISATSGALLVGDLTVSEDEDASASTTLIDSPLFSFRGTAYDQASSTVIASTFSIMNDVQTATTSLFSILSDATSTSLLTISDVGDVAISGKFYPSDRGNLQYNRYIYYDGSSGGGGDRMRTNAAGWGTGSYDFAEMFPASEPLEPGDIVIVDPLNPVHVKKSTGIAQGSIVGIVSTQPGFLTGDNNEGDVPIALQGRVPTKVTTENGIIRAGDYLTPSSQPGMAMRASFAGPTVAIALEDYDGTSASTTIIAYVHVSWFGGDASASGSGASSGGGSGVAPRAGLAVIASGDMQVDVTFESLASFPIVHANPYDLPTGEWGIRNVTDVGFTIVLMQTQTIDLRFAWTAEPSPVVGTISKSDGTTASYNTMTGEEMVDGDVPPEPPPSDPPPEPPPEPPPSDPPPEPPPSDPPPELPPSP